mmetsp:Transcript_3096/g.7760  ORF Transcript_3096/g.7760 Transcript_3096/m.7760 type:complete len:257 (-) Transcript_3096:686-1456(-)
MAPVERDETGKIVAVKLEVRSGTSRVIHVGDALLVQVQGQDKPGLALLHEIRETGATPGKRPLDCDVDLIVFWLYQRQDLLDGTKLRDEHNRLLADYDWLACPARVVTCDSPASKRLRRAAGADGGGEGGSDSDSDGGSDEEQYTLPDGSCHEVLMTAHRDELLPAQIIHPAVVHWLPGADVSLVTDAAVRDPASGRRLALLRPGFVCRRFMHIGDTESKVKSTWELGSASAVLTNVQLAAQIRALIKATEKQLRK